MSCRSLLSLFTRMHVLEGGKGVALVSRAFVVLSVLGKGAKNSTDRRILGESDSFMVIQNNF